MLPVVTGLSGGRVLSGALVSGERGLSDMGLSPSLTLFVACRPHPPPAGSTQSRLALCFGLIVSLLPLAFP